MAWSDWRRPIRRANPTAQFRAASAAGRRLLSGLWGALGGLRRAKAGRKADRLKRGRLKAMAPCLAHIEARRDGIEADRF